MPPQAVQSVLTLISTTFFYYRHLAPAVGNTANSMSQDEPVIPGLELAILQHFQPDQDVVLNPGDILYLPPGYAHHGVALERCMTYSIGFRAPTC